MGRQILLWGLPGEWDGWASEALAARGLGACRVNDAEEATAALQAGTVDGVLMGPGPAALQTPPAVPVYRLTAEGGRSELDSALAAICPSGAVGQGPAMRRARALVERVADAPVPVLLLGESGVGKEVIAREIHARSRRRERPFIKVNCAALPSELLESELFGYERGAFTGAHGEKPGKFELADGGTLFLDEIGEMAVRLQAKLLQVLQDEEFFRVGGKKSVHVDARVVAATNRELEREIAAGNFREDLFYRLNVVSIRLSPLRERKEDILPLVRHFSEKYGVRAALPSELLQAFLAYDWPGNVRELENAVRRLSVLKDPAALLEEITGHAAKHPRPEEAPPAEGQVEEELSLKDIGKRAAALAEREAILAMLERTGWNKRKAARRLRISYKALLYKIRDAGIRDPRAQAEG
ncbi:MAG: hypothetical protein RL653_1398 [Pseudomonadota bacterium]|jgi:two-component system response regulator AtoC